MTHLRAMWMAAALATASCSQPTQPLDQPLPPSHVTAGGVHLVVLDTDLPEVAETIRLSIGKSIEVASAPWPMDDSDGHVLGALSATVDLAPGKASWTANNRLQLTWPVPDLTLSLSVAAPGDIACALHFLVTGGQVRADLDVRRSAIGTVAGGLAEEPEFSWKEASLQGPDACLSGLEPAGVQALADHLAATLRGSVLPRVSAGANQAARTLFPSSLEQAVRWPTTTRWGDIGELRLSTTYLPWSPQDAALVAGHEAPRAYASLAVGVDVDRAGCVPDLPPPAIAPTPLAGQPPAPPQGSSFLRRALVIDRASLSRIAWALHRSGALCQDTTERVRDASPSWAPTALPSLADWVEGAPLAARFWPGAAPIVSVASDSVGPVVDWRLTGATLELTGLVGGTELVVLSVSGEFRVRLRLTVVDGANLGLQVVSAKRDSSLVSSPLFGGNLPASGPALDAVVDAAVAGIFSTLPVLPLGIALPSGTMATGTSRAGDSLWLWLDSAPGG
ncbi:MAG: hypothetical protein ACOYOB_02515 [Myxococcota bacterium]